MKLIIWFESRLLGMVHDYRRNKKWSLEYRTLLLWRKKTQSVYTILYTFILSAQKISFGEGNQRICLYGA